VSLFMNKLVIIISLLLLFGCSDDETFTASDCITRIEFEWQNESDREKASITTEFMDSFISYFISSYGTEFPPPSSAVQGENREFIFLQFTANCKNKVEMTKSITEKVLMSSSHLPTVLFSNESFKPSYNTILVDGPYWRAE